MALDLYGQFTTQCFLLISFEARSRNKNIDCFTKNISRTDIYLHVLSVGNLYPPDIHYEFMVPAHHVRFGYDTSVTNYYWRISERWSECSSLCQGCSFANIFLDDFYRLLNNRSHFHEWEVLIDPLTKKPTTYCSPCNIISCLEICFMGSQQWSAWCVDGRREVDVFTARQITNLTRTCSSRHIELNLRKQYDLGCEWRRISQNETKASAIRKRLETDCIKQKIFPHKKKRKHRLDVRDSLYSWPDRGWTNALGTRQECM